MSSASTIEEALEQLITLYYGNRDIARDDQSVGAGEMVAADDSIEAPSN